MKLILRPFGPLLERALTPVQLLVSSSRLLLSQALGLDQGYTYSLRSSNQSGFWRVSQASQNQSFHCHSYPLLPRSPRPLFFLDPAGSQGLSKQLPAPVGALPGVL